MPGATPIPRSPSVFALYTAADLLTRPGCPVCGYVGEASDRYLAWFALEAHAQIVTITRLRRSLGMCPRHTRGLMSQPGAATRLTAVYGYVMGAARDQLAGRVASLAACPACEHDDAAAGRALETLLEGLADSSVRECYRELGGLCIPHLHMAIARARKRLAAWLSETLMTAVSAPPPDPGWLAGTDHDADVRAVLRKAIPVSARPGPDVCLACLAEGRSESHQLAIMPYASGRGQPDHRLLLCASHLNDRAVLAGRSGTLALLTWQADCLAANLSPRRAPLPGWKAGNPASWLRSLRRPGGHADECAVCSARQNAAGLALDDFRMLLREAQPDPDHRPWLCVRHQLSLRAVDPWAGHMTSQGAVQRADMLLAELGAAFRENTWARRHEARGEMSAWRRAAAFLDGGVFCGCPPRET
jgi:hypothetical protein